MKQLSPGIVMWSGAAPPDEMVLRWDVLVSATHGTDVTQLSVWARVKSHAGHRATYVLAQHDGQLVGGALVLARHVPAFGCIGYVPYGPIIKADAAHHAEIAQAIASALEQLPGMRMLFVQPPEQSDAVCRALRGRDFRPTLAGIAPTGSMRVDLTATEDEIRSAFSRRLRSWTGRWAERGVSVRRGDEDDVPLLADLMRATAVAKGYSPPPPRGYLRILYAELARAGNAALFVGEVNGIPVTADLVTMCGRMVRGRLSGFDRCGAGRGLSVPAAARWEIIRWAKGSGYRCLDFGGLSERTLRDAVDHGIRQSSSWPGPDQAKMAFGGVPFRYPTPVGIFRPSPLRYAYDASMRFEVGRLIARWAQTRLRTAR